MKEIKIDIPEGYEIDKENSTFECIKFRSIKVKRYITYKDCCKKIFPDNKGYYITNTGEISNLSDISDTPFREWSNDINNATTTYQLQRLLALNQLINIAYYYNGKKYIRVGYYIGYDKLKDVYFVEDLDNNFTQAAEITALFMYAEDAQAVIDNPNFRVILDTLCK